MLLRCDWLLLLWLLPRLSDQLQEVCLAAILPHSNTEYAWAWPRVGPALLSAVRRVNSDPGCSPLGERSGLLLGLHRSARGRGPEAGRGPLGLHRPRLRLLLLPRRPLHLPLAGSMVTAGARAIGFDEYNVTNTGPTHKRLGQLGLTIQEEFGWSHRAMLLFSDNKDSNDDRSCYFAVEGLYTQLQKRNITVRDHNHPLGDGLQGSGAGRHRERTSERENTTKTRQKHHHKHHINTTGNTSTNRPERTDESSTSAVDLQSGYNLVIILVWSRSSPLRLLWTFSLFLSLLWTFSLSDLVLSWSGLVQSSTLLWTFSLVIIWLYLVWSRSSPLRLLWTFSLVIVCYNPGLVSFQSLRLLWTFSLSSTSAVDLQSGYNCYNPGLSRSSLYVCCGPSSWSDLVLIWLYPGLVRSSPSSTSAVDLQSGSDLVIILSEAGLWTAGTAGGLDQDRTRTRPGLSSQRVFPWLRGDSDDKDAKLAFRNVKIISYHAPQTQIYSDFVQDLKRDAKKLFNFTVTDSLFWSLIGVDLVLPGAWETPSELHKSYPCSAAQKRDLTLLKNWRQFHFSVWTTDPGKVLANRLKDCLDSLIHPTQTYCIPGRTIMENLFLIRDSIDLARIQNMDLGLLCIDQEKAFDRVDHLYLFRTLTAFGFSRTFTSWIRLLYTGATVLLKVGGGLSRPVPVQRVFGRAAPFWNVIRDGHRTSAPQPQEQSEGLHTLHLSAYADDVTAFITDAEDVRTLKHQLELYERASSARVNWQKCEGLLLGRWEQKTMPMLPAGLSWSTEGLKCLGVYLGSELFQARNWEGLGEKGPTQSYVGGCSRVQVVRFVGPGVIPTRQLEVPVPPPHRETLCRSPVEGGAWAVATNRHVAHFDPRSDSHCPYCPEEETLEHLWLSCPRLAPLFRLLRGWVRRLGLDFTAERFIFGPKNCASQRRAVTLTNFLYGQAKAQHLVNPENQMRGSGSTDCGLMLKRLVAARLKVEFSYSTLVGTWRTLRGCGLWGECLQPYFRRFLRRRSSFLFGSERVSVGSEPDSDSGPDPDRDQDQDSTPQTRERRGDAPNVEPLLHRIDGFGADGRVRRQRNGFDVWDMTDLSSAHFQVVALYTGSLKRLVLQKGRSFQWPGGAPPPDTPECGFKNDKPECVSRTVSMQQLVSMVICFVFIIVVTVTVFIYRKLRLESELAAQLWRVNWDEVQINRGERGLRRAASRLTVSMKGSNCGSLITVEGNVQIYTKTGLYKGNLAAIKYMNKKRIELSRSLLFELKHMRDVQNEHLTRFLGACVDPPNCCIITEYCPRGSLQKLNLLDWDNMIKYKPLSSLLKGPVAILPGFSYCLRYTFTAVFDHSHTSENLLDNNLILKSYIYKSWSIKSNAALKSNNTVPIIFLFSISLIHMRILYFRLRSSIRSALSFRSLFSLPSSSLAFSRSEIRLSMPLNDVSKAKSFVVHSFKSSLRLSSCGYSAPVCTKATCCIRRPTSIAAIGS
ncbi:hypothetical protein WMY93_031356, partial [Mugilogobius chulae]